MRRCSQLALTLFPGCAAPHMIVPAELVDNSTAAVVTGKGPFTPTWQLGELRVSGAWEVSAEFGFELAAPGGEPVVVRCDRAPPESGHRWPLPGVENDRRHSNLRGAHDRATCTLGGASFDAAWTPGLAGRLVVNGRSLDVTVARGIEGDDLPTPSGFLFTEAGAVVGAFETVGPGRLLTVGGLDPEVRLSLAASSIVLLRCDEFRDRALMSNPRERGE